MAKLPKELLDAIDRSIEAGFQAQDAYQMELQKPSTRDTSQGSQEPTSINGERAEPSSPEKNETE